MKTRLQNRFSQSRFSKVDIAALLVFIAVWTYYFFVIRYGVCTADEHGYFAVTDRLVRGDRPFVDEWVFAQLSMLFLYIPYKLFITITGGTAGIILCMRILFLVFNAVFYWYIYVRLREYTWLALIASLLFSAYIPGGIFSCNYYTIPTRLIMTVCLILFREKQKPLSLLLAGLLLSCSVLCQPVLALLYFGYTALVWIRFCRQKKGKRFLDSFAFCLHVRAWKYMTISVILCAAAFLTWLFVHSGVRNILDSLPYMLMDPEYDFSSGGTARKLLWLKFLSIGKTYGYFGLISALVVIVLAVLYACGVFRARQSTAQKILFCLACALWILSCVQAFRISEKNLPVLFFSMYPLPLFCFGFVCYLLCEQKNKRFLLFWVVSLCFSFCFDAVSEVAMSVGSPIAYIADLVFFGDLARELCADLPEEKIRNIIQLRAQKIKRRRRLIVRRFAQAASLFFAAWAVFTVLWENPVVPAHWLFDRPLFSHPVLCEKGPCRSLHYPDLDGEYYNKMLTDIDTIRRRNPKNLFVCGMAPELYLYADLPCAAYSCWGWRDTPFLIRRNICYWALHPERLPECIYVPIFETYTPVGDYAAQKETLPWIHDAFDALCDYTLQEGEGGYILYVSQWNEDMAEIKQVT